MITLLFDAREIPASDDSSTSVKTLNHPSQGEGCSTQNCHTWTGRRDTRDLMVARQLILNASDTPDQLKAIEKAFDEAWTRIAPSVSDRRQGCRRAFACEALGQMDFAD
ncbi:MAG TPA: hypothetical protein VG758_00895, partial [Hyphomicrobiaceae bacterium]|nr:hypothetical protein [Hyphomicrobiaceae bacterium]